MNIITRILSLLLLGLVGTLGFVLLEVNFFNLAPRDFLAAEDYAALAPLLTRLERQPAAYLAIIITVLPRVVLAGFSEALGHTAILFANRVRPNRFAATILINTVFFAFSFFLWVASLSVVAMLVFGQETAFIRVMLALADSYWPLLYGFLIAAPYFGLLISNILYVLVSLHLVNALQIVFPFTLQEAALCALGGLLVVLAFRLTVGRPIAWLSGRLRDAVVGSRYERDVRKALDFARTQRHKMGI